MSSDLKTRSTTDVNAQPQQHHEQPQPQQQQQQQQQQQGENAADQPKKAKRKRITPEQLEDLVGLFEKTDTPSFEIRESLAHKLGMTNREIQVWFQNRRAKANRVKINEQAAFHHHHHMQQQQLQQQQQQLQGHHHLSHHRSNSANGFGGSHPSLVHSAPSTPLQSLTGHHHHHHQASTGPAVGSGAMSGAGPDSSTSSYGYFGANGSSSPPRTLPTPTPRAHPSNPNRRPVSLYNMGSHGLQQYQQQPQKPGQFQPMQHSSSSSSSPSPAHFGSHPHGQSHPAGPYGMDIILPANSSSSSSQQRPILPPPISTMGRRPGQSLEEYEETRRPHRHERTLSEGYPSDYISPTSMSPISPPPERHMDTQYRDDHEDDSPTSVTHSSPFTNGGNSSSNNSNRHSASLSSFGLKAMTRDDAEPNVIPREKQPSSAYYNNPAQAARNRRSYDDDLYDEHQQLMRDSFNMETRLVISEDEPRPESAIDILAYAAAFIQESEEHKKENKDVEEKRDALGQLNSNKRQSFHGPSGYPSKEPFQEESSRYPSSSMAWEASPPVGSGGGGGNDVMPIPRRRGGDDGPYAPRRPRPVTYGGSGFLYDHQENQFLPQSPSSSFGSYSRASSSSSVSSRRLSNRNSTEVGSGGLLLQRGLTRPRRSSSTAASGLMNNHMPSSAAPMPVLPPIISENNSRLLSPAMVPSPQFGSSRLTRQDSQGNSTRDSPGSDSYSHTSRDDMEDIEEDTRAAKRRSGTFFGVGGK
ncbi:hypothetical protein BGX27_009375 [Mortierella sp. AM989]|nr:hypothetical protein BGX27_009375 [Mortierella sp. AM989]